MPTPGTSRALVALALLAAPCVGGCGAGEDLVAPEAGGLEVSSERSGGGDDPDGIVVVVDDVARHTLLLGATLRLPGMSIGRHTVAVEGLGTGCSLEGPNPRGVIVVPDSLVPVVLNIVCAVTGPVGTLVAAVRTSGADPDADGYALLVDTFPPRSLDPADTIAFTGLSADSHVVRLAGVADRCTVTGANPWVFKVEPPDTADIAWEIACWPPASGRIAFVRIPPEGASGRNVYMIRADGTGIAQLTRPDGNIDQYPEWSPDGTRIAYVSDTSSFDRETELRVLEVADGSLRGFPIGSLSPSTPRWSPDGTQLGFVALDPADFETHVYVIDADGLSPPRRLARIGTEREAVWSPDGSRLAFIGSREFGAPERVYVADRNGTSSEPVSPVGLELTFRDGDIDWSPDGSRIVFSAAHPLGEDFGSDLYAVGAGGGEPVNLTASPPFSSNVRPRWSPDGRLIAYVCSDVDREGIIGDMCTIPAEGGARVNLTNHLEFYSQFDWSPDGSKLVFSRTAEAGGFREDLFVMNADGSGLVRLTRSDANEFMPSWGR